MEEFEGTYFWVVLNNGLYVGNPWALLSLLFLFFARFLPIIALSPFFGARVLPHPVKVFFAISVFVIFLPQLITTTTTPIDFSFDILMLMVKEMFVGTIIGFMMGMPFIVAQNAGIIIDHQRGGASLMVNDPTIQNQSSPLGTLFNMVLIFLFFMIDGPFLFLNAILTSYELIPPDKFLHPNFFNHDSPFWQVIIELFNKVMVLSMQISAPALLAILMTDMFLGIANRLAPQVQITFLGMPLKSLLALVVVCFGWILFNEELVRQCYQWLQSVSNVISLMGTGKPLEV